MHLYSFIRLFVEHFQPKSIYSIQRSFFLKSFQWDLSTEVFRLLLSWIWNYDFISFSPLIFCHSLDLSLSFYLPLCLGFPFHLAVHCLRVVISVPLGWLQINQLNVCLLVPFSPFVSKMKHSWLKVVENKSHLSYMNGKLLPRHTSSFLYVCALSHSLSSCFILKMCGRQYISLTKHGNGSSHFGYNP